MKILMINVVCGIRSTGRICSDLATVLDENGYDVKIAYGRDDVPDQYRKFAVRIGSNFDVFLHGISSRVFDGCGWGSKGATKRFIRWIEDYNPDIIHIHNIHGYFINVEILFNYLRRCQKKIIWTLHDCWAFTGHSAYCDYSNCNRWITGCYDCPNLSLYPKSFIDRSEYNWRKKSYLMGNIPNLTIVTPSIWLAEQVKQSYLKNYPIHVIYNGIDTSKFHPVVSDFKKHMDINNKIVILGVSTSWDDMKGFSDYIKLASILGEEYKVVLVGLTEKQKKTLPSNLIGITRTNSVDELISLYSAADIYVNLSYCESFGMTNIESQLCGTPVISYDSGGCIESAQSGVTVPRGDLVAIVDAIKNCRFDKPIIDKNKFDYIKSQSDYLNLYLGAR